MPKYQVLTPIESANVLYVPEGTPAAMSAPSACHGKMIPVDTSGFIELTEEETKVLVNGQVPTYQGKADPVNGAEFRAQKAKAEADAASSAEAQQKAEYDEFVAFRAAKAKTSADAADSTDDEPSDAPTIKCEVLKDFQSKGEKYKQGEPRELTLATIRRMGRDKIKVIDVEAYEAAKKK